MRILIVVVVLMLAALYCSAQPYNGPLEEKKLGLTLYGQEFHQIQCVGDLHCFVSGDTLWIQPYEK